ncbi:vomeronasal type-2 receptor 26-like [Trichosurus vulpecula]|uniref:vomeronasal type-2 receptor 26-like n=1 Tax=Trichosurus vulpecula TaxID=9337 RepID=UPI00186AEB5D|nr:vomeronasal type-2 receptor 26-like [Trichosurus vulpecula]
MSGRLKVVVQKQEKMGDVLIGASQGFVFATEEINRDTHLLPNLTLGFSIWDSGDSVAGALRGTMDFLTGQGEPVPNYNCRAHPPLAALIGELRSALSVPIARWLGLYKFPQDQDPSSLWNRTETRGGHFCTGSEHLQNKDVPALNVEKLSMTYSAYKAVYSIAHALQDLSSCEVREEPTGNRMCPDVKTLTPWQLLQYIRKVHFQTPQKSEVFFDANGDLSSVYEILNVQKNSEGGFHLVNVGYVDSTAPHGKEIIVNKSAIQWKGGKTQVPQSVCSKSCPPGSSRVRAKGWPHCCFDCEPCPEGQFADHTDMQWCAKCPEDQYPNKHRDGCLPKVLTFLAYEEPLGMTLSCMALTSSFLTVIVLMIFVKHRDTPIVKSNNRALSYILLLALTLCFLCSFLFIGRPTTVSCLLQQMTFGIIFTVAISSILAKTIIVVLAFKGTRPGSWLRRWARTRVSNAIILICSLIQVILCGVWIATSPPFLDVVTDFEPGHILIVCNEGSITAFYCVLGYMGFLALGSFTVAFLARNLPDTFNEAKFITFSMLVFFSVWISFLYAYQSTKRKTMVAVEVFAILASGAGMLICIFIPKCYVVLWRSHQNTQEWLKGHPHSRGAVSP